MDIHDILDEGENTKIEFKEHMSEGAYKTISSFANTEGGILLYGISDDKEIIGIDSSEKNVRDITNKIVTKIEINPHIDLIKIDKKKILLIQVEKSFRPISYNGKYYMRIGSTTREMPENELITFFQKWSNWDTLTNECGLNEIDETTLNKFINRGINNGRLNQISENDILTSKLEQLGLYKDNKLTNAAIMLFGKNPQKHFPNAIIRIARFEDEITIIGDKFIEGNLFNQIEEAEKEIKNNIKVKYEFDQDSFNRKDIWDYPIVAIREALINAIAHRDYFKNNVATQVKIFNNYIHIFNIGGLPEGITIDQLKKPHASIPRNQLIIRILYRAGFIEELGTGIKRIIMSLKEEGMTDPEFKEEYGGFSIFMCRNFLKTNLEIKGLNDRQIKALNYVYKNRVMTMEDYSKIAPEVEYRTLRRDLEKLVKDNIFLSTGNTKGRKYKLNYFYDILK
ncbi:RNA-binding domain-containing protein [Methanobrevibacter filiformis]|uniref:Divergent AAA domain protein n=1 Tax=Methanobrevibacter filiformis TaxID=55758 RepID=A0A165Z6Z5_9EURY|nr:RNA-binding domain-containing protein [Methanobrevibacter filiformis]KZX10326.1 divergent AAA domain protein [Methanobrevibacter filiformis]